MIFVLHFRIFNQCFNASAINCNTYLIIWTFWIWHFLTFGKSVYNPLGFWWFRDLGHDFLWEYGHSRYKMSIFPKEIASYFEECQYSQRKMHPNFANVNIPIGNSPFLVLTCLDCSKCALECFRMLQSASEYPRVLRNALEFSGC